MRTLVIGAGAWGTALAQNFANSGKVIDLICRNEEIIKSINHDHKNPNHFEKIELSKNITATNDLDFLRHASIVFVAVPTKNLRALATQLSLMNLPKDITFIICSKGIEQDTLKLPTEIFAEFFPKNYIGFLSGPNFAAEVIASKPTATSISLSSLKLAETIANDFSNDNFRIYFNDEVKVSQICAAYKNVLAISSGICAAKNFGCNAQAALISRGMAELKLLAKKYSNSVNALLGLAGVGDIVLTCYSDKSRNYSFGKSIVKNSNEFKEDLKSKTIEGAYTVKAIHEFTEKYKLEMPIAEMVYNIIYGDVKLNEVIKSLFERPVKKEF